MYNFYQKFQDLKLPTANKYSAFRVDNFENHRIAKDKNGNPNLLIFISNNIVNSIKQNLYSIRITHNIECEIIENNTNIKGNFSIISYDGHNDQLIEYFLKMCEMFIVTLGNTPSNDQINQVVDKFVELFKNLLEPSKNTLQGLWAELFFIVEADNVPKLVYAWHQDIMDKCDFSFGNTRIEVKSSKYRKRIHSFSAEQLYSSNNIRIYIASIFVETMSNGLSIQDLLDLIESKLKGDINLINKVRLITFSTLGNKIYSINQKFDYQLAKDSLRMYNAKNVPKILTADIPAEVSNIVFKSSLENVQCVDNFKQ